MHSRYFQLKSFAWWQQSVPERWPLRTVPWICRMMALLISGLFLFTGLPLGNWPCCCATNPMHFTTLGNGTRLFLLPRSVCSGTQPIWRYGCGGCFLLLCCFPSFLSKWMFWEWTCSSEVHGLGEPYLQRSSYKDGECWNMVSPW